jgi:dUTP pyrophosphatase
MSLYIYVENNNLRDLVRNQIERHRWTDSGFDVPMLEFGITHSSRNYGIKLGIKVAAVSDGATRPCLLLPRSSIGASPFRMTNSIGLIDQGYRGEVQAKVDVDGYCSYETGSRFFQICRHDFLPWNNIVLVQSESDLPAAPDNRGSGGFGSTGIGR